MLSRKYCQINAYNNGFTPAEFRHINQFRKLKEKRNFFLLILRKKKINEFIR